MDNLLSTTYTGQGNNLDPQIVDFVSKARQQGYSDEKIAGYMQNNGANPSDYGVNISQATTPTSSVSTTTSSQPKQQNSLVSGLEDLIPAAGGVIGNILGGVAGALIPGVDLTGAPEIGLGIAGGAAGQAGGKILENILQGKPMWDNVGKNAIVGGVAGGVGGIAGKAIEPVGKAVLNPLSTAIDSLGGNAGGNIATAGALETAGVLAKSLGVPGIGDILGVAGGLAAPGVNKAALKLIGVASDELGNPIVQGITKGATSLVTSGVASDAANKNQTVVSADSTSPTSPQGSSPVSDSGVVPNDVGSYYDKNTGHYELPTNVTTQIPGQPYPQQVQMALQEKINHDLQNMGNNPWNYKYVAAEQQALSGMQTINDNYVNTYVSNNKLGATEEDFMQNANAINSQVNQLRDLIDTSGGNAVFNSILGDNSLVQAVKAKLDPNGYGKMLALMTTLGFGNAKTAVGGRLTNYDVSTLLGTGPQPGDTPEQAKAKLDLLQQNLVRKYTQYLPMYHYTLQQQTQPTNSQETPSTLSNPYGDLYKSLNIPTGQ